MKLAKQEHKANCKFSNLIFDVWETLYSCDPQIMQQLPLLAIDTLQELTLLKST